MFGRVARVACVMAACSISITAAPDTDARLVQEVKRGNMAAVRALLAQRVDVNAAEADGTTALHWAVRRDDGEMVTRLLSAGANANEANRYGVKPLTLAAINGSGTVIERLLEAGADPNTTNAEGETALMTAARTGSVAAIRPLLARGARVDEKERWFGETALMWAAAENHADAARALIAAGADVNARSALPGTPKLDFPRSGGPVMPWPQGGWTPLMYAARQGAIDGAKTLADAGADLNLTDPEGATALVLAIVNAHYDLAAMLVGRGADPNVADQVGMAALYAAVDMSSLQWTQGRPAPVVTDTLDAAGLVKVLLEHGANPDAALTAPAIKRHHPGSDASLGDGTTPLMRAAKWTDVRVAKMLLDAGADPFRTQKDYTTAFMIAAGVTYNGIRGEGPRIPAATEANAIEIMRLLLDRGADVDAFNAAGTTALHGAVGRGEEVVKFLLERGAKANVKNKAGRTPLDLAMGQGGRGGARGPVREGTAKLLRQYMGEAGGPAPPAAARTSR